MRKQGSMEQRAAVIPARSATTKQVWRPRQVVPWVESRFTAHKAIITLRSKIWAMHFWPSSVANFDLCECFLACKLYQKRGAYVRTQNWHVLSDRSDRCAQRPQYTIWTSLLDRSRRVDRDSYMERPNQSPDGGRYDLYKICTPSTPVWTVSPDRSDQCPRVRTKTRSHNRFRLIKGFPYGARPLHTINIKGYRRLRYPIDQINLLLYFYLFSLPYTFPIYYLLFLLRLFVDWGRSS
jgi:hypothetical protein